MSYENEKYVTTPEKLKETIETYGVGIIPNVLDTVAIESLREGMWNYLENVSQTFVKKINRNDPKT